MNKIFFITGALGSGKTTTIKNIEKDKMLDVAFCYFDSVGVPTKEEMEKQYGSGENWQKATMRFFFYCNSSAIMFGNDNIDTDIIDLSNIPNLGDKMFVSI